MGDTKRMRKRRQRLWDEQNGLCFWCSMPMILARKKSGTLPKQYATIDHLRSRYHQARWDKINAHLIARTVLACFQCNNTRSTHETKQISIIELWARSGCRPRQWHIRVWRVMVDWLRRTYVIRGNG